MLHRYRYVLRRLLCQQISCPLPIEISQHALIYHLPHATS